jgi:cellulose synthase/poly-beta-1,6-N-acetylglucosamine synthase-like glycosyltransferase
MLLLEIIVVICFLLIVHSYVLFPIILKLASAHKSQNSEIYSLTDELPSVALLLAVYNEEEVIVEKILSTFKTNYPVSRLKFYIGSDASTDETNKLISKYANEYPIELVVFPGRTGKSGIINKLAEIAKEEILILTDANVFFKYDTIYQLVKHYKNKEIAQVGGNIINPVVKKDGISFQEKTYLSRENLIKYQEGVLWGTMIGAFGGCYSIRAENYRPVPKNFLMDDFYISMNVIEQGKKAINELDAQCIEDVSNKIEEEFRRKVRISAGNFQNLNRYKSLLWPPFTGLSFCFLSHKVLRWYTPVLLLLAFICILILSIYSNIYIYLLFILIVLFASPLIDNSLKRLGLHIKVVRFATHFILMNFALLKGLIWYTKGVQTNVWQPTQRNQ